MCCNFELLGVTWVIGSPKTSRVDVIDQTNTISPEARYGILGTLYTRILVAIICKFEVVEKEQTCYCVVQCSAV